MRLAVCGGGRLFSRAGGGFSTTTWTVTSSGTSSGRRGGGAEGGGTPLACLPLPLVRVSTWCFGCRLRNSCWHSLLEGEEFLGMLLKTLLKPVEFHRCSSWTGSTRPSLCNGRPGWSRQLSLEVLQVQFLRLWVLLCSCSDKVESRAQWKCLRFIAPFEDFLVSPETVPHSSNCACMLLVRRDGGRSSSHR